MDSMITSSAAVVFHAGVQGMAPLRDELWSGRTETVVSLSLSLFPEGSDKGLMCCYV